MLSSHHTFVATLRSVALTRIWRRIDESNAQPFGCPGFRDQLPTIQRYPPQALAGRTGFEPAQPFGCEFSKLVRLPFRHLPF
jgi:hypothetical protein